MEEVVAEPLQQPLRNLLGLWFVAVSTEEWRLVIIIGDPSKTFRSSCTMSRCSLARLTRVPNNTAIAAIASSNVRMPNCIRDKAGDSRKDCFDIIKFYPLGARDACNLTAALRATTQQ
jgi:hypothetical protein